MRAYLFLTFTALCWGANAVFGRVAVGEMSPMAIVSLRWLGVLLLLLVVARKQVRADWPVLRGNLTFVIAMGATGFAGFNAIFYVAAHSTTAVNIGIIQGSIPVFVLIGAFFAYRARITGLQSLGVAVTMVGVIIVGSGGNMARLAALAFNQGDLMMIVACMLYAGYTVGLRKRPAVSALGLMTVMAAAAFVTSLPLSVGEMVLDQFQWPTPFGWLIVGLITIFPSFLAQISFIYGVGLIGPGRAGPASSSTWFPCSPPSWPCCSCTSRSNCSTLPPLHWCSAASGCRNRVRRCNAFRRSTGVGRRRWPGVRRRS